MRPPTVSALSDVTDSRAPATRRSERLLLILLVAITGWRLAVLYTAGLTLYVDEAQYWTWAQHLDWGYYSKPPVIAAVIAGTTALCGNGELCVKSGALLIYPLVALLIYAIAARLFDRRTGFWSAVVFFTLPGAAFSSMIISTDVPLFLCWTAALYAYLRAIDGDRWRWWVMAGVAAGVGLQTKYTMIIFAPSVLLHLAVTPTLRDRLRRPQVYVAMVIAALIFLPNLVWNAQHGWPTLHHTTDISGLEQHQGLQWKSLGDFLGGQFGITGPVFLLAWLLQLLNLRGWIADARYRLLACFALPFLAVISLQALLGRANANWAAMTYAAGIVFVVARLIERGQWRWLWIGLVFNLAVTVLAYHFDFFTRLAGVPMNHRTDVYKRVRGWDMIGQQAAALRQLHPDALFLADDRDVLAELEYYVRNPHPLDAVEWNPRHQIDSHYALTTTMDDKIGRNFLYVTRNARLPPAVTASFAASRPLPPLRVEIHPDYVLDFHVWLLTDFRGYR